MGIKITKHDDEHTSVEAEFQVSVTTLLGVGMLALCGVVLVLIAFL